MKIYLAGPDVFLPDAVEIGKRKAAICARHGVIGHYPLDNAVDLAAPDLDGVRQEHIGTCQIDFHGITGECASASVPTGSEPKPLEPQASLTVSVL